MASFAPPPQPKTALGRHRVLSPTCGLRVSPFALGAMSIGESWKDFMGSMDKEKSFELLDAFVDAGGNFIDTANNYQEGESEAWIGEWAEKRGIRDELVIATKYTTMYKAGASKFKSNYAGNHYKSMFHSVNDSLKKLRTSYIDLLYMHWIDWQTPVEEVMQSLNILVKSGKVLYLGVSDTPAWWVAKANAYARHHALAPFVVYQGKWSLAERDFEREILQMTQIEGLALCPWNVVGGGKFQSAKQIEEREKSGEGLRSMFGNNKQSDLYKKISAALEKVGNEVDASVTAVAIAYVMSKQTHVFPLVGGRKVEHLMDNIKALSIKLTPEQVKSLEDATEFSVGFPIDFVGNPSGINFLLASAGHFDFVKAPTPL